ncbi:unnamed protein product [Sphenostylis stenocarpa]|uniref:Uncharacterized protein n=1 Tax=Sphenostylis stenocarpa TaxID=92480 RepID=A0AA86SXR7_9FABA|nr:unnamed protein product [Sphenostylis stenocarpa]
MHMLSPFVCGTFHNEYDDDDPCLASPLSSPRKYKRKDSKKNPYSSRGLDKFSELLADLDEKRQQVYSQMNPHDISFVRFVYSNTNDIVPVVVKVKKNNKDHKHNSQELKVVRARTTLTHTSETIITETEERNQPKIETNHRMVAKKNFSWDMGKPSFYLPVVMVLILLLLVVFGRSATTLYTCVLWYVISTVKGSSPSNTRMSTKKKDYVRGLSEKKIVVTNETVKKKDYVRGWSEKKMVNEGTKKKDYVRDCSEKKMVTDWLLSPKSGANSEAFKKMDQAKHSRKKSW